MTEKHKGLVVDMLIYVAAFVIAAVPFYLIDEMLAATAAFTGTATLLVFLASCFFRDVSVYDPYWSVAPPIMLLLCMIRFEIFTVNAWVIFLLVLLWAARLTANWYRTYRGIGHEDWRYRMFREKYSTPVFLLISFFGLHFVPTIVVYLGLVSGLLVMREQSFTLLSLPGALMMPAGVVLELVSDRAIHRFLAEHRGERRTCNVSVWKFSRHPNYLGEMSFWTGMYLYFLGRCPGAWYKGLGFLTIIILFLFVSIPMMEKHNLENRTDYGEYREKTSVLLLLPSKAR